MKVRFMDGKYKWATHYGVAQAQAISFNGVDVRIPFPECFVRSFMQITTDPQFVTCKNCIKRIKQDRACQGVKQ